MSTERWSAAAASVREAFVHAWRGYEQHAWGADELLPLTNGSRDNWGGLAVTMVDALDTLLLLGLTDEYERAREWLRRSLPARLANASAPATPFFEGSIRVLHRLGHVTWNLQSASVD